MMQIKGPMRWTEFYKVFLRSRSPKNFLDGQRCGEEAGFRSLHGVWRVL